MNRNRLDRVVVKASDYHRFCGQGVLVEWKRERSHEFEPALSYMLCAGSSRLGDNSGVLAVLNTVGFRGSRVPQSNTPGHIVAGPQISQEKNNERGLYEA